MNADNADLTSNNASDTADSPPPAVPSEGLKTPDGRRPISFLPLTLAALATAFALWFATPHYPFFTSGISLGRGANPTPEQRALMARVQWANPISFYGLIGASLGVALSLAVAARRRRLKLILLAAAAGVLCGGGGGALGGAVGHFVDDQPYYEFMDVKRPGFDLGKAMVIQTACWSLTALGVGLAVSFVVGSWPLARQVALGTFLLGLLAAPCFQFIALLICLVSPVGGTDMLVPEGRLNLAVYLAGGSLLMALGASCTGPRAAATRTD